MSRLTIIADENIPAAHEYFSTLGQVHCVDGRQLNNEQVREADILLVRSVTAVNQQLLNGTRVRFVATATAGIDHLDTHFLDSKGIGWASAPGCNAGAVVDYVISALCRLPGVLAGLLAGATVGIIGMGNVGSRLYQRLNRLGVHCRAYDPLIAQHRFPVLTDLADVLACQVICCHTPLTTTGQYPTHHMLADKHLNALKEGTVLINAGRGAMVDNQALKRVLATRNDLQVVLDVWENEPAIDTQLLKQISLGSAHIAGYSLDGKLAGTQRVYQACCDFLQRTARGPVGEQGGLSTIELACTTSLVAALQEAVLACYDVLDDDKRLRDVCVVNTAQHALASAFDRLRKHYPVRREFSHFRIGNTQALDAKLLAGLAALGFSLGAV